MTPVTKRAGALLAAGALLCCMVSCGQKKQSIQILEEPGVQPEYLSFFSSKSYEDSEITKYWSDRFAGQYHQQVYISHDGASYYAEEGLSYRELLEKRLRSSAPDDLYIINAEDVMDFDEKGYWMDLSEMDFVENLSDAALYQSTYRGKVFSVPLTITGFGFYWNVTMLEERGLSVPENLEEFLMVCEKLKADGILPYGANKGFALTVPAMCRGLAKLYNSPDQEQRIAALNSGAVPISSYMREGFAFLSLMIEKGYLDPVQAMNTIPHEGDVELFLKGECAFICSAMGEQLQQGKAFRVELSGLPLLENGCIAVYGATSRLCVNPDSKHMETALKFIEMVGTPEALDQSAALSRMMSSARDSRLSATPAEQKMHDLLMQPGQIPNQDFSLHFNTWESIRDVGREICSGISVDEACAKLDELQTLELSKYA